MWINTCRSIDTRQLAYLPHDDEQEQNKLSTASSIENNAETPLLEQTQPSNVNNEKKKRWFLVLRVFLYCAVACAVLIALFMVVLLRIQKADCFVSPFSPERVTEIRVESGKCNGKQLTSLHWSVFPNVKRIVVNDAVYKYVNEVNVVGLKKLQSVVIGENSFTRRIHGYGNDPNRRFILKDCPSLKELKMGRFSFSDYGVIEVSSLDSLEVIEMGTASFYAAILQLKGTCHPTKLIHRPADAQIALLWRLCLCRQCYCLLREYNFSSWNDGIDLPTLTSIDLGLHAFRFRDKNSTQLVLRSDCTSNP